MATKKYEEYFDLYVIEEMLEKLIKEKHPDALDIYVSGEYDPYSSCCCSSGSFDGYKVTWKEKV